MTQLIPLLLLWMWGSRNASAQAPAAPRLRAPKWPTTSSPPPLAAFEAKPTPTPPPSADPSGSSTPLAVLQRTAPAPKPITESKGPTPASQVDNAKRAATAAIKKHTTSLLRKKAASVNLFGKSSTPTSSALVSNLQDILARHGVRVVRDGLYGPRTAAAWSSLARKKGLPSQISRGGPKIANVATQTFERLNEAAIP